MPGDRKKLRGTILAEDRLTERFFAKLLEHLGFTGPFYFRTAPSGVGDAGAWVRAQYALEVRLLRGKSYQRQLCLVAVRDGDNAGVASRKSDLETALSEAGLKARQRQERIATPVPTWSIETWLLALLGDNTVDESRSRKRDFRDVYPRKETRNALRDAARAWRARAEHAPSVPSLADGSAEMTRID